MPTVMFDSKINTTIGTARGIADYSHSEIEDENGKWDDHWEMSHGEYVIHEGPESHHVYLIRRNRK